MAKLHDTRKQHIHRRGPKPGQGRTRPLGKGWRLVVDPGLGRVLALVYSTTDKKVINWAKDRYSLYTVRPAFNAHLVMIMQGRPKGLGPAEFYADIDFMMEVEGHVVHVVILD